MSAGQLASLVAGLCFLAVLTGREDALAVGRIAFWIQWVAYLAGAAFLVIPSDEDIVAAADALANG